MAVSRSLPDKLSYDGRSSGLLPNNGLTMTDHATLTALNTDYINAVQNGDVARFEQILDTDFYCSNPDGALIDRAGFLRQTAQPVTIKGLVADDVKIRLFGDTAVIHGRTNYTTADGRAAKGRYTDVWAKRGDTWKCVSAHVTRG
jgi:ketosteroid isomerase-like protein